MSARWPLGGIVARVVRTPDHPADANFSFRTLCNYVSAFALWIEDEFSKDFAASAAAALQSCTSDSVGRPLRRLTGEQEQALVRGWSTESLLRQPLDRA